MPLDRGLVQRVHDRRVRGRPDVAGDRVELGRRRAGEVHGRAFAGERTCDRTADGTAAAVDHRGLLLEPHERSS
jgi:hypothetical protein